MTAYIVDRWNNKAFKCEAVQDINGRYVITTGQFAGTVFNNICETLEEAKKETVSSLIKDKNMILASVNSQIKGINSSIEKIKEISIAEEYPPIVSQPSYLTSTAFTTVNSWQDMYNSYLR